MSLIRDIKKLIRTMIQAALADVHTNIPAQVISYNATDNTVSCRPCIKRIRTDDPNNPTTVELPILNDIPVKQFGTGEFVMTVPPVEDSYGVLVVSERELEQWLDKGGVVDPGSTRKFDLSDAIFDPGLYTIGGITNGVNTDRIEFRTLDGSSYAALVDNGTFEVNGNGDSAALTSKVDQFIADVHYVFDTGWVPAPPDGGAALQLAWWNKFGIVPGVPPSQTASVESDDIKVNS